MKIQAGRKIEANGFEGRAGEGAEHFPGLGSAFGLEALQFRQILVAVAAQAGFLNREIAELALIGEENLGVGEDAANRFVFFVSELGFEFHAADGVDAGFQGRNAGEAPFDISHRLHEHVFGVGGRFVTLLETGQMFPISGDVVTGQQDGATCESGLHGVHGRLRLAFRRSGASGELSVGAVGFELLVGRHAKKSRERQ